MEVAATTHMGPVELSVSDLDRTLDYWQNAIGLRLLSRDEADGGRRASLGADRELLRFVEEPGAKPARGHAGLYHVALLLPDRKSLARWLAHVAQDEVALEGLSDHAVSEAVYLRDPDQHGIEVYADRPREQWEGRVKELMTTEPLDVESLFAEVDEPRVELPDGTVVGHTHLCVSDVDATVAFYRDVLGFELMVQLGPMAAFFAAGGYHHHIGGNTWESRGATAAPPGTARLLEATIVLPDAVELEQVANRIDAAGVAVVRRDNGLALSDPSGNPLFLTA